MKNNGLEKKNFFSKLKAFIYKIFHKANSNTSKSDNIENIEEIPASRNRTIFDEYRKMNERRNYLLELQQKLEIGEIDEEDMYSEDRNDLKKLYLEQISLIKRKIKSYEIKNNKL